MPPDALALYAAVILLLPMVCFFLSSPTFLLVGLEIPEVTQLLRGLFNGYFLVMGVAGVVSAVGFAVAGRPVFAVGAVAVAIFATVARRWFLQRIDAELQARVGRRCHGGAAASRLACEGHAGQRNPARGRRRQRAAYRRFTCSRVKPAIDA